ncbi:hypothetical protein ACFL0U_04130 [Pseudomonadota bacterium]
MPKIAKVLLPYAFKQTFDYLIPENLENNSTDTKIHVGDIVIVPFGNRTEFGVIWEIKNQTSDEN